MKIYVNVMYNLYKNTHTESRQENKKMKQISFFCNSVIAIKCANVLKSSQCSYCMYCYSQLFKELKAPFSVWCFSYSSVKGIFSPEMIFLFKKIGFCICAEDLRAFNRHIVVIFLRIKIILDLIKKKLITTLVLTLGGLFFY